MKRRSMLHLPLILLALALGACAGGLPKERYTRQEYLVFVEPEDLMLQGHDVVALFTQGQIRKGAPQFQTRYHDATYWFASQQDLDLFVGNPDHYKPAYGGHCAVAAALGHLSPAYIETWRIVDDRLYVQHNEKALNLWLEDVPGNIVKGDRNWPQLVAQYRKKSP